MLSLLTFEVRLIFVVRLKLRSWPVNKTLSRKSFLKSPTKSSITKPKHATLTLHSIFNNANWITIAHRKHFHSIMFAKLIFVFAVRLHVVCVCTFVLRAYRKSLNIELWCVNPKSFPYALTSFEFRRYSTLWPVSVRDLMRSNAHSSQFPRDLNRPQMENWLRK